MEPHSERFAARLERALESTKQGAELGGLVQPRFGWARRGHMIGQGQRRFLVVSPQVENDIVQ
jgi:hypothetical protein